MSELSPTYWDDVNRDCRELLAGVPVKRIGAWILGAYGRSAIQRVSWPAAEPNTEATLTRGVNGGRFRKKSRFHELSLITSGSESQEPNEYSIVFHPKKKMIERASSGPRLDIPVEDINTGKDTLEGYFKRFIEGEEIAEELGLHLPGPEDYALLLSELERGVSQK